MSTGALRYSAECLCGVLFGVRLPSLWPKGRLTGGVGLRSPRGWMPAPSPFPRLLWSWVARLGRVLGQVLSPNAVAHSLGSLGPGQPTAAWIPPPIPSSRRAHLPMPSPSHAKLPLSRGIDLRVSSAAALPISLRADSKEEAASQVAWGLPRLAAPAVSQGPPSNQPATRRQRKRCHRRGLLPER